MQMALLALHVVVDDVEIVLVLEEAVDLLAEMMSHGPSAVHLHDRRLLLVRRIERAKCTMDERRRVLTGQREECVPTRSSLLRRHADR